MRSASLFKAGTEPEGKLGKAIFEGYQGDQRTSTLIGVMMGFLPTVDGNIRGALFEWINDRSLWDYQLAYLADKTENSLKKAGRDPEAAVGTNPPVATGSGARVAHRA